MKEYHKIHTLFKRDMESPKKPLKIGEWSLPEFDYLQDNDWEFTEKVDGTNIRIIVADGAVTFGGKTDNALIPAPLVKRLQERFLPQTEALLEAFPDGVCLYGEGYGAKIQKGHGYREDQDFVLFDVKVGEWWLQRDSIEGIAMKFGLDSVPVIGFGTLHNAARAASEGFNSNWGDFIAEGIVARPTVELKTRQGHRIIAKIKHVDFKEA